jgi:Trk K+ transport system NAD-binding subunit
VNPRIVVCDLGRTGYRILTLLQQLGVAAVGVHDQPLPFFRGSDDIVVGDPRLDTTLITAGIQAAESIVLASADDALNLAILVRARLLNPEIRIVSRLFNTRLGDRLDRTLEHHVTASVSAIAAPIFSFAAFGNTAIGHVELFERTWPIHEELIDDAHPWLGLGLHQLWEDRSRMSIYYRPAHEPKLDLVSAICCRQVLQVGDRLIVATRPQAQSARKTWKERFRRSLTWLDNLRSQSQSSIIVFLVLLLTILLATWTYVSIDHHTTFVDSLYFSVGMITGAGGQEDVAEHAPASVKIFTAVMMLVGAGTIGIAYALLNDWVLGTRFRQVWDMPPIPHRHHYIVCGLGGIGIQIARHLHDNGYEVVVIERDPQSRFLSTARSLRIPVITGDATLSDILETANVKHCAALFAVSSDDTTNLEISLTAKELVSTLRVVVRTHDSDFADMVQRVFNFEAVLSPTEIAAHSFAAAALGGRILGSGMTGGQLWIALAVEIDAGHPLLGQCVQHAAMRGDFVPLYLESQHGQTLHAWDLLDATIEIGQTLYLTVPSQHLDRLWVGQGTAEAIVQATHARSASEDYAQNAGQNMGAIAPLSPPSNVNTEDNRSSSDTAATPLNSPRFPSRTLAR